MEKSLIQNPSFIRSKINTYLKKGFWIFKKGNKLAYPGETFKTIIEQPNILAAGLNNITYNFKVQLKSKKEGIIARDYILRIVDRRNMYKVKNEVDRMKQAVQLEIPIPYIFIFEDDLSIIGSPFIIMQRVFGYPVMDTVHKFTTHQTQEFLSDLAKFLGTLHSIRVKNWDSYYLSKNVLREKLGRKYSFQDYIMYEIKTIMNGFNRLKLPERHDLNIQYLYKWFKGHSPLLQIEEYSLVHGDIRPSNIMVQKDNRRGSIHIAGIIDWEMSCYSDPASDLGWTLFFFKLYENLRKERGFFFKEYWKYCSKYNFEARVDFYETLAAIKLYTYAVSTQMTKPEKFQKNREFFNRVYIEAPKYIDRLAHRD